MIYRKNKKETDPEGVTNGVDWFGSRYEIPVSIFTGNTDGH